MKLVVKFAFCLPAAGWRVQFFLCSPVVPTLKRIRHIRGFQQVLLQNSCDSWTPSFSVNPKSSPLQRFFVMSAFGLRYFSSPGADVLYGSPLREVMCILQNTSAVELGHIVSNKIC